MSASAGSAKQQTGFLTRAAGISEDDLTEHWAGRPAAAPVAPFATPDWQPATEGAEPDDAADGGLASIVGSVEVAVALLQRIAEDPLLRPSHRVAARRHLRQIERAREG
jgi:hypothetical protein